ncbi:MAG: EamA family transporter [Deltaproteobacteria bacterium]|nr:EamA family transporter [Deltaproteobacteria bacterium]
MARLPSHVVVVLIVAVLAISSSAVIVRAIEGVHPLAIAFWRTLAVAVLLAPAARRISVRDAALIGLSGACLAAHFTAWFASLQHITVMRSTVLVSLGPVWTGLLEWGVLGHRPRARFWGGLALAVPGVALLTGALPTMDALQGDVLALLGGVLVAGYFVIGRSVRRRVGIGTYACLVCAAAAAILLPVIAATGTPATGYHSHTWVLLAALAIGPQLLGHNGLNYALRYLRAGTVSSLTILEPVGATVLAALLLAEYPTPVAALGAAITVLGVGIASWTRQGKPG